MGVGMARLIYVFIEGILVFLFKIMFYKDKYKNKKKEDFCYNS